MIEQFDSVMFKLILAAITMMLGVIGYFLRQLHADFSRVTNTIVDMDKRMAVYEERLRGEDKIRLLHLKELESRIEKLEKRRFYKPGDISK